MPLSITPFHIIGLVIATIVVLFYSYRALTTPQTIPIGWSKIEAGNLHWLALGGWAILTVVLLSGWLFGPDEEFNSRFTRNVLYWITLAAAAITAYTARFIVLLKQRNVRWHGSAIHQNDKDGSVRIYQMADLVSVKYSNYNRFQLGFADGRVVVLDGYMEGFPSLMATMAQYTPQPPKMIKVIY